MSGKALWFIAVVVVAFVLALTVVSRNPRFTPDGFQYSRVAMQDTGLSPADALLKAEAFYIQKPIGQIARYRKFLTVDVAHAPPAPGPIFRTRVLYPWVASLFYRWRGLAALADVSLGAYVASVALMYWLLLALARPWVAAMGALASVLHYTHSPRPSWIVTFGLATILLGLTRQVLYLPIGAVAGAFIGARVRRDVDDIGRSIRMAATLGLVVVASSIWYVLMHGAGIVKELEIGHGLAISRGSANPDEPLASWYRRALASNIVVECKRAILNILPVLALIATALEIRRRETAILIGAAVAGLAPLFLDPSPSDMQRVLEAPLFPVVLAVLAIGAERLLRRPSSDSSQYDGLDVATAALRR